jgi:hypothetical protein
MALTKSRSAAAQRTTTGVTDALDLGASYDHTLAVRHVNGTGTITAQGTAVVEWRTEAGTTWFTLTTLGFGTTASAATEVSVDLPPSAGEVRLDYTVPTGSTGHTLDAEVGLIPSL